jgi:hypothetical protein
VIVCSERSLHHHLRRFVDYYHQSRTHLGLHEDAPEPRPIHGPDVGPITACRAPVLDRIWALTVRRRLRARRGDHPVGGRIGNVG